jgi:hypothetical protein
MIRAVAAFAIALVTTLVISVPAARAWQPIDITACETIKAPGSYVLASNLTAKGDCLV